MIEILSRRTTDAELFGAPGNGVGGMFYVELIDAATGLIKQAFSMPNVVTSAGLNSWLAETGGININVLTL